MVDLNSVNLFSNIPLITTSICSLLIELSVPFGSSHIGLMYKLYKMLCDDFYTAAALRTRLPAHNTSVKAKVKAPTYTCLRLTMRPPSEGSAPYVWYMEAFCYGCISACQGEMCEMLHTSSNIQRPMDFLRFIQVIVRCRWFARGRWVFPRAFSMPLYGFQCFVQTQQFFSSLQLFLYLCPLLSCQGLTYSWYILPWK